jgi:hypothetical protein
MPHICIHHIMTKPYSATFLAWNVHSQVMCEDVSGRYESVHSRHGLSHAHEHHVCDGLVWFDGLGENHVTEANRVTFTHQEALYLQDLGKERRD